MDPREYRSSAQREQELFARLPTQIAYAKAQTPHFASLLADVAAQSINSRDKLAELPITRKHQLVDLQKHNPPFGGLCATPAQQLLRIFQSPGPIYEPQGLQTDNFRLSRALRAAGFMKGDLVSNTFSYHFTPGAWMMESAAHAVGCCVFPAGTGQTEMQARAMAQLQSTAYVGTPSFLKTIIQKADELELDISSLQKAVVSGEALTPSLQTWFSARGLNVLSAYATADVGLIAYQTSGSAQSMVIDEDIIVEIVEPNGDKPVPFGEVGEVVVTVFDQDYPLIRFATGDLSAFELNSQTEPSACGRTNVRIVGWLGRADQTTKIKGMFVHPSQVADIVQRHAEIAKARLVINGNIGQEQVVFHCELNDEAHARSDALTPQIEQTIRDVTKLRATVQLQRLDSLPQDNLVIEDARSYD